MSIVVKKELKEGESFKLKGGTSSFKKGENIEISGFLDEAKTKVICKGLLPGGFIPISKLDIKPALIPNLRFKSIIELFEEYGLFLTKNIPYGLSSSLSRYFGKKLEADYILNYETITDSTDNFVYNTSEYGFGFSKEWVTTKDRDTREIVQTFIKGRNIPEDILDSIPKAEKNNLKELFIEHLLSQTIRTGHLGALNAILDTGGDRNNTLKLLSSKTMGFFVSPLDFITLMIALKTGETIEINSTEIDKSLFYPRLIRGNV